MREVLTGLVLATSIYLAEPARAAEPPNLMPLPSKWAPGAGALKIDGGFSVAAAAYSDARLERAMRRLLGRIHRQTGLPPSMAAPGSPATLTVVCREGGPENPALGEDESYQLDVEAAGARLTARTVAGALRGMETFAQLAVPGPEGFAAAAIRIDDRPRFPWRGLMIDVSRHWMPVEVIERNLDAMAAVKLNVLHWHLSDDQGFRVECKRYPRLHELGSDGNFYTQDQVREVIAYARDRAIRVVPEFDVPGHATSWVVGYPELASAPGPYAIERTWGVFEPTLDPSREETYAFLDGFIGEMAALFPDPFLHLGGDEVQDAQWKRSAAIQDFARRRGLAGSDGLQGYFHQRVAALATRHGKKLVGWDEMLRPGLPKDTVIQSWRGQQSLAEAARKGYRGILSCGYYLDHLKTAAYHYAFDPLDGAGSLTAEEAGRILGGEAPMWSEYVSPETVDSRIWPRAAAIAERLWSPREVLNVESMYTRMEAVSRALDAAGACQRSNYGRMLDRLAGGRPSGAVRVLADAVEALGIEGRRDARKYSSLVPLNRLVDAARPESETVRELERAAQRLAPADTSTLRAALTSWRENHALLAPLARENFLLRELEPLSEKLSELGSIGLRALDCLEAGHPAPDGWVALQKRTLDGMEQPGNEVRLAAVRPIRILLQAMSPMVAAQPARP